LQRTGIPRPSGGISDGRETEPLIELLKPFSLRSAALQHCALNPPFSAARRAAELCRSP
jgi:hypothetical protein